MSEKFAALVEAVKSHGILNPISVRPNTERQWVKDRAQPFIGRKNARGKDDGVTIEDVTAEAN